MKADLSLTFAVLGVCLGSMALALAPEPASAQPAPSHSPGPPSSAAAPPAASSGAGDATASSDRRFFRSDGRRDEQRGPGRREGRMRERLAAADANADGTITSAEWTAAGLQGRGFSLLDANGDGKATRDDIAARLAKLRQRNSEN